MTHVRRQTHALNARPAAHGQLVVRRGRSTMTRVPSRRVTSRMSAHRPTRRRRRHGPTGTRTAGCRPPCARVEPRPRTDASSTPSPPPPRDRSPQAEGGQFTLRRDCDISAPSRGTHSASRPAAPCPRGRLRGGSPFGARHDHAGFSRGSGGVGGLRRPRGQHALSKVTTTVSAAPGVRANPVRRTGACARNGALPRWSPGRTPPCARSRSARRRGSPAR